MNMSENGNKIPTLRGRRGQIGNRVFFRAVTVFLSMIV